MSAWARLAGKRRVSVRERRTKVDWATEIESLLSTQLIQIEVFCQIGDFPGLFFFEASQVKYHKNKTTIFNTYNLFVK